MEIPRLVVRPLGRIDRGKNVWAWVLYIYNDHPMLLERLPNPNKAYNTPFAFLRCAAPGRFAPPMLPEFDAGAEFGFSMSWYRSILLVCTLNLRNLPTCHRFLTLPLL